MRCGRTAGCNTRRRSNKGDGGAGLVASVGVVAADVPIWRNARIRAVVYQVLIVAAVVGLVYSLATQAAGKLAVLGIKSGFDFLAHRAGFRIGEALPVPVIRPDFFGLVGSIVGAVIAVKALIRWAARHGRSVLGDPLLMTAALTVLLGLPIAAVAIFDDIVGFKIHTPDGSIADALIVGMLNTLLVSIFALAFSTVVGLIVALMRLSKNWLVSAAGGLYVELVRNLPLLLHLFFWYFAVLRSLPGVRQSLNLFDTVFINNRGVFVPRPELGPGVVEVGLALAVAAVLTLIAASALRRRRDVRGDAPSPWFVALVLLLGLPALAWAQAGAPLTFTVPTLQGLNFRGALVLTPEFATLLLVLTVYHGAYNAEIIRSGILSVPKGQSEAAFALGLAPSKAFSRVILPQALRVIVPPLIGRYLGLVKSSSLAVAIGYPDLVSVGNSITYATGQAIEIVALTMTFYLSVSLLISLWMNWYNARLRRAIGG
jgi:general L-amino acid transport system permease protein